MLKKKRLVLLCLLLIFCILFALGTLAFKRMYPLDYQDVVTAYAHEAELPISLVNAVICCESRFRPGAVSSAGACGLMQLTPSTFRELVSELCLPPNSDLFDPATNIRCGTYYLQKLIKLFPEPSTALAAYNAGIGNVSEWLADPKYSRDGRTLHTIPFAETRKYVKRVLFAQKIYEKIYSQKEL